MENIIGTDFGPEDLCAKLDAGEDEAQLKIRPDVDPRSPGEFETIPEKIRMPGVGLYLLDILAPRWVQSGYQVHESSCTIEFPTSDEV